LRAGHLDLIGAFSVDASPKKDAAKGEQGMANKSSFTPEEWNRVVGSPMVVSMAVTASDPSGL
jgi:hypothetical protein